VRVHLEVAVAPDWRPLVPRSGRMVGGTEALAFRLATLLAADGHDVSFRGGGEAGVYRAVHLLADDEDPPLVDRWIAVNAERADAAGDARRVFWSHAAQLPVRGDDWDEIVGVSGYHAGLLEARLGRPVTANPAGVEPGPAPAAQDRFLYASSPDRGLHRLLAAWPAIWARWRRPLSITYELRAVLARRDNQPGPLGERLRQVAGMLDQPGVVVHGALDQTALAALRARSLALLYPLDPVLPHSELYALSVLEACAAGVPPILAATDCFPKEYTAAACFVNSFDADAWVSAIDEVLSDRGAWSGKARAHAARRTWAAWEATWHAILLREVRQPRAEPYTAAVPALAGPPVSWRPPVLRP
jgi:hypothetical protein